MKFFRSGVMFRALALSFCLMAAPLMAVGFGFSSAHAATPDPAVKLETNYGDIIVRLDARKAPISTANFVQYVKSGFYDGTIFHRVIKSFMIQGGGFTPDLKQKETRAAIRNEADNGLKNKKYTIAMARTGEPHSATAQFFINTKDNDFLDFKSQTPQGWGYAVFGKVLKGQEVVDKIAAVTTGKKGYYDDVPMENVIIKKAVIVE
ncbi:peptidylprolyl isomerase [Desulfovibrio sp. 86]|uniref:Peptidyl-prolyl cis-trans isomerase n=2 Tax=uncultured Desulfovibrio sp. TaxID=167968 RepID=A0A212L8X6_9BACT|nr:Peptidyl-prolyl cis-trans isomerase [uncultured Desulfovibrio sp.]VZH34583.1 Peptidyl-prolyl cis-trans isomerase [Desulfovibrio sp. 86]